MSRGSDAVVLPGRALCFAGQPRVDALPDLLDACRETLLQRALVVVVRAEPRVVRHFALAYGSPVLLVADDGRLEGRYLSEVRCRPATVLLGSGDRIVAVVREAGLAEHVAALLGLLVNRPAA